MATALQRKDKLPRLFRLAWLWPVRHQHRTLASTDHLTTLVDHLHRAPDDANARTRRVLFLRDPLYDMQRVTNPAYTQGAPAHPQKAARRAPQETRRGAQPIGKDQTEQHVRNALFEDRPFGKLDVGVLRIMVPAKPGVVDNVCLSDSS